MEQLETENPSDPHRRLRRHTFHRHLLTQVNSPWTNGKIERFWGLLQAEVLDRHVFGTPEAAEAGLAGFGV